MRHNQIVRAKGATGQHIQDIDEIEIPDLWGLIGKLKSERNRRAVTETWHLCHDLREHVKRICRGRKN